MQIELTKKEFRRLLDLVYIGNWVLNSTRGDDRFTDYDEVVSRFSEDITTLYEFNGGVYGIPLTQNFPMLFYRKDVLSELEIEIPKTWEDVYNYIANHS